jgi:hypothetical protein
MPPDAIGPAPALARRLRVLQFFRAREGQRDRLLDALRRRARDLQGRPGWHELLVLTDDVEAGAAAALDTLDDERAWEGGPAMVATHPVRGPDRSVVGDAPIVYPLRTLWERELASGGATAVIAELVVRHGTARHFADLLMPLALRGVSAFSLSALIIGQVRSEPERFFVISRMAGPAVRDDYVASAFRRDEVLPIIGPYLARPVRRHSMTLVWRSGPD